MGAQGNAERQEKSLNTRLIFLLVYLVLRLSATSIAKQSYEVERAIQAKEREEAQRAEALSARDEAKLVQAQVTDDHAPRFAADADVRTVEGVGSLSFAIPAAWGDGLGLSTYDSVFLAPSTYDGQCWAIAVPDLCLSSATARDAADFLFTKVRSLSLAGDAVWSGALGRAVWYRYPVVDTGADHLSYESGFLEVILTGRDAYFLVTVCDATQYTTAVQDEMLCVLDSVAVPDEAPLLYEEPTQKDSAADGTLRARDLADEGDMARFLVSTGDFRPLELSGTGDDLLAIPRGTGALLRACPCLVTATYEGSGRFMVRRVEEAGGEGLVLIDREGSYHGVVTNLGEVVDTMQQDKLEVTAEGDWSIRFAPLADTPLVENGATYTGDALVFMDEGAIEELHCVHEGAGEFSVYAAGCDGSASLVDASGPCDETAAWDDPHTLFVVHAEGDWRLSW